LGYEYSFYAKRKEDRERVRVTSGETKGKKIKGRKIKR